MTGMTDSRAVEVLAEMRNDGGTVEEADYTAAIDHAIARLREPARVGGEVRLWDSQWSNIVNAPEVLNAERQEDAVSIAVRMDEAHIAKNVAAGNLPPTKSAPQPPSEAQAQGDRLAINMLVAAGFITEAKANEALNIAHGFDKGPLAQAQGGGEAWGWVTPEAVQWSYGRNRPYSEVTTKITREPQPEHGFTVPLYLAPPSAPVGPHTYASTQATKCAGCGEHKHTPLRIDAMGGYVCLTCIDQKLGSLLGEFGYASSSPVGVEGLVESLRREAYHRRKGQHNGLRNKETARLMDAAANALTQQPAAVDEATVDRALEAYLCRQEGGESLYGCVTAAVTAALAAQPGGSDNDC